MRLTQSTVSAILAGMSYPALRSLVMCLLLGSASVAMSKDVIVTVSEVTIERISGVPLTERVNTRTHDTTYTVRLDDLVATVSAASTPGTRATPITRYAIVERQLTLDGHVLASASQLLCQCRVDGQDIVVVERSRNSVNPLFFLAAVSGHPVQYGEVWLYVRDDRRTLRQIRLLTGSSANDWRAKVAEGTN